jgi:uncharacterized protein (TIGR03437 family)
MTKKILLAASLLWPLGVSAQIPLNTTPSLAFGQPRELAATDTRSRGPNWVEGRELDTPSAVALDPTSGALYVADTGNNRVLAWRDGRSFQNGARADLVIGQRDFYSNRPITASALNEFGLNSPTGLAVDARGHLYVVDAGNNRIVRYKRPFDQTSEIVSPDMAIGQPNLTSSAPGIGVNRIRTTEANAVYATGLAFDSQGNLYFTDAGNNRVLRFPASSLAEGAGSGPAADLLLGQSSYDERIALAFNENNRRNKSVLRNPSGVALDAQGRLYVADALNRVLVWEPRFVNGQAASRILGISPAGSPPINASSLGVVQGTQWLAPNGVFTIGSVPFVVDTFAHRILRYPPFDLWPPEQSVFSPPAEAVIGQDAFESDAPLPNRGRPEPNAASLASPLAAVFAFNQVYVADTGNNRVLVFPDLTSGPPTASGAPYVAQRVLGQIAFDLRERNLIEGKEFQFTSPLAENAAGIAVDTRSDPPRLYVADTYNNRILCFADARRVRPGDVADRVIGQPDPRRSVVNWPTGRIDARSEVGLFWPTGLAVDPNGDLYVADRGNARVLRFPRPFDQPPGILLANLVLGQADFAARSTVATSSTMAEPYGLAFTFEGWLLVSDRTHNRVLLFQPPFRNGQAAIKVFGQQDFISTAAGSDATAFNGPRHIATDADDRLYVVDAGNRRVQVFPRVTTAPSGSGAVLTLPNFNTPRGIFVSSRTGEIWVAESGNNSGLCGAAVPCTLRYPRFDTLLTQGVRPDATIRQASAPPLGVAQDGFGNLLVADSLNRVLAYFPGLAATNAANYLPRLAPGMIASLFIPENQSIPTMTFEQVPNPIPLPRELGDVQVLVNQRPAPLFFVSPTQINLQVPSDAPESGTVEFQVVRPSTLQILASAHVRMERASPALFTRPPTGTGQIAALNQDNTINSATNPARVGEIVQLFGTGAGRVPGAPPDGTLVAGPTPTEEKPRVFLNSRWLNDIDESLITYSGLAPGLVGVWQINFRIPTDFPPPGNNLVIVSLYGIPSNNPQQPNAIRTTIAIQR